jgi:hypothetical protein
MLKSGKKDREKTDESAAKTVRPRNYSWAELMKRVFDQQTNCMSPRRIVFTCPDYTFLFIRFSDKKSIVSSGE